MDDKIDLLRRSVHDGDVRAVKSLLDQGVNVNAKSSADDGWVALFSAAQQAHPAMVKFLLESKADASYKVDRRLGGWVQPDLTALRLAESTLLDADAKIAECKRIGYDEISTYIDRKQRAEECIKLLKEALTAKV